MNFIKLFFLALPLLLFSCQWDSKESSSKDEGVERVKEYYFKQVLFEEEVTEETLAIHAQAGDYLKIELSGKKFTPKFSGVYHRGSTSTWEEERCRREPRCRLCDLKLLSDKERICYWYTKRGGCTSNFRNHEGDQEEQITFEEYSELYRLHYKIGDTLYPLGEILDHKGESVTLGFLVTEEMLKDTDEVKFVIKPDPYASYMRVGFLGYHSCSGIGRRGFNPHIGTGSINVSTAVRVQYKVNLYTRDVR